jgi:hypothetical protein
MSITICCSGEPCATVELVEATGAGGALDSAGTVVDTTTDGVVDGSAEGAFVEAGDDALTTGTPERGPSTANA